MAYCHLAIDIAQAIDRHACGGYNSSLPCNDDRGIQTLIPGRFLIKRSLGALPNPNLGTKLFTLLKQWHLCQGNVKHF